MKTNYDHEIEKLVVHIKRIGESRKMFFSTVDNYFKLLDAVNGHFLSPQNVLSPLIAFLDQISPQLFGIITESEFRSCFTQRLAKYPYSAETLCLLITSLDAISSHEQYRFEKQIEIIHETQRDLLQRVLHFGCIEIATDKASSELECSPELSAQQFAFTLSSFADRVYNFVGKHFISSANRDVAARMVARFEDTLLSVLVDALQNSEVLPKLDVCANLIADYNAVSGEFTNRFLSAALQSTEIRPFLPQIFANAGSNRRRRETLLISLIGLAPDGQTLQAIFGSSPDQVLFKLLTGKAILQPTKANSFLRNSQKAAEYFYLISPADLLPSAFSLLLRLLVDQCAFSELVSLNSQFSLALANIDFARRITPNERVAMRDEFIYTLVPIVPEIVKVADLSRRQIGMFMTETLFSLFECPEAPHFDYVESDPVLVEFRIALQTNSDKSTAKIAQSGEGKSANKGAQRTTIDSRMAILFDSDDDEGNVPPPKEEPEPGPSQSQHRPDYLRDCLEALGAKEDDCQRWSEALRAIPEMLSRRAVGWDELAMELLEKITFLDNRFGLPGFSTICADILKRVLANCPELVSHACRIVASKSCSMSHRYLLIAGIVQAAKLLVGGSEAENGRQNEKVEEKKPSETGPKVVWKSAILDRKNGDGHRRMGKNPFHSVAAQFVFPLLDFGQFFRVEVRDFLLLSKLIWAVAELVSCARNSPSIVRITSATFGWLCVVRRGAADQPALLQSCLYCYASISQTLPLELLREHFAEELLECQEWLANLDSSHEGADVNESVRHSIAMTSIEISQILGNQR